MAAYTAAPINASIPIAITWAWMTDTAGHMLRRLPLQAAAQTPTIQAAAVIPVNGALLPAVIIPDLETAAIVQSINAPPADAEIRLTPAAIAPLIITRRVIPLMFITMIIRTISTTTGEMISWIMRMPKSTGMMHGIDAKSYVSLPEAGCAVDRQEGNMKKIPHERVFFV